MSLLADALIDHPERCPGRWRPRGCAFGDPIPFWHDGVWHLFHLRMRGEALIPWGHIVSRDLVAWQELPDALAPGAHGEPDGQHIFTGSVIAHRGRFHIWYTGRNRGVARKGTLLHAVSDDLVAWRKLPEHGFGPDGRLCHAGDGIDFRDPHVTWDAAAGRFHMCFAARDAATRLPVLGQAWSDDLERWTIAPHLLDTVERMPECPDRFALDGREVLLFSPMDHVMDYRLRDGAAWSRPAGAVVDTPFIYAGKRAWDGRRQVLFAWIRDLEGARDGGRYCWGGSLCTPRQLALAPDGRLLQTPVAENAAAWPRRCLEQGAWEAHGAEACLRFEVPADLRLVAEFSIATGHRCQLSLRDGYHLVLSPQEQCLELVGPGLRHRRDWQGGFDRLLRLEVLLGGDAIECFIDGHAISARCYDHPAGPLELRFRGSPRAVSRLVRLDAWSSASLPVPAAAPPPLARPVVFQQPPGRSCGDPFPFWHDGVWHLIGMEHAAGSFQLAHRSSRDLVTWEEQPTAILPGDPGGPDDANIATGCTVRGDDGVWRLFYTGNQVVCCASSRDLIRWEKHPGNPLLRPDARYDPANFRDPWVVRLPDGRWRMLLGSQDPRLPRAVGACVAQAESADLEHWTLLDPLWAPGAYCFLDCPTLLPAAGAWHLLTLPVPARAHAAPGPDGPFRRGSPRDLGGMGESAMSRVAVDGDGRIVAWGFIPRSPGPEDFGGLQYGGALSLPRVFTPRPGGGFAVAPVEELRRALLALPGPDQPLAGCEAVSGTWTIDPAGSLACAAGGCLRLPAALPDELWFEAEVTVQAGADLLLLLRCERELVLGYQLEIQIDEGLVSLRQSGAWDTGRVLDQRRAPIVPGRAFTLQLVHQGELLEVFIDGQVSLSARTKRFRSGCNALVVRDAGVRIDRAAWRRLPVNDSTRR